MVIVCLKNFLCQLKSLAQSHIPESSFEILEKGISARIYFCHELMDPVISSYYTNRQENISINEIRPKLIDLINADFEIAIQENIMEGMTDWVYWKRNDYVEELLQWILQDGD